MAEQEQTKVEYERPKIVDYGTLRELTQGGWGPPWGHPGHGGYPPS